jgi:hypothetical protein
MKMIAITCCGALPAAQLPKSLRLNSAARWWDDQAVHQCPLLPPKADMCSAKGKFANG